MSKCPACGRKLRLTDISQHCPHCGVNLRFVGFEENFYRDAKNSELSMAAALRFVALVKASFIGTKAAIARIAAVVLCAGALLVPAANADVTLPFFSERFAVSGLGIYNAFSSGLLKILMTLSGTDGSGAAAKHAIAVCAALAVSAVICVVLLFLEILGFTSLKRSPVIMSVFSAAGMASAAATGLLSFLAVRASSGAVVNRFGFGWAVQFALFAALLIINIYLRRNGFSPVFAEGVEERCEIRRRVKAGELSIDDLPQPIVETEETRQIAEEIRKERESLENSRADGGSEDE